MNNTMIEKVEEMVNATNLTRAAALEQVKKADAPAKAKRGPRSASTKAKIAKAKKSAKPAPAKKAKKAKAAAKSAKPAKGKGATILALIARKGGATATELQEATGWQAHSVRGFLSTASKKGLAKVSSAKREDGQRVYSA